MKKKDTYKEIHKSNKLLSDYKNGNKTIEKSINRLRNILTNEDFYILKKM